MANTKISALPAGAPAQSGDLIPIARAGSNASLAYADLSPAVFSVKSFGAKGDGSTDDTTAIQSAITAAVAVSGKVYFPAGTYIISPPTTNFIFNVTAGNVAFVGDGIGVSILKIKNSAGDYKVVFGPYSNAISNILFQGLSFNQNTTNNPVTGTITTLIRALVVTNHPSNNLAVLDCEFTDVNCLNMIVSYNTETVIRGCRFTGVGGGTTYHDSSLLYIAGENSVVENNIFIASAPGAAGAVSAIETHGGKQTITGNTIDAFQDGINVTGVALTDSDGITVTGNAITRGYYGIDIFSSTNGSHNSGFGVFGLTISGNSIVLNQILYTVNAQSGAAPTGNPSGIFVDPSANLPLSNISITGNTVVFDLESSSSAPYNTSGMGIGYWDSTTTNSISHVNVSQNLIVNATVNGIRFAVNMTDVVISGNVLINPGSSSNSGVTASFQNGMFLASTTAATDIRVLDNVITDNQATSRMVRGITLLLAASSEILLTGNVFTVSGATHTSYLFAIDVSTNTQLPYAKNTQVLPKVTSSFPSHQFAQGSTLQDASTGSIWTVGSNGTTWAVPGGVGQASFADDFLHCISVTIATSAAVGINEMAGDTNWAILGIVGTTSTIGSQDGSFSNPGEVVLTADATSGHGIVLGKGGASFRAALGAVGSNAGWEVNFVVKVASTASIAIRAGLFKSGAQVNADPPTDGMWIEYDTANTGNTDTDFTWVTRSASTPTYSIVNAVAADTNFHHFKIRSTTAGTILFSVDGGTETSIATNVSTATMTLGIQAISRTSATKAVVVDFVSYLATTGRT